MYSQARTCDYIYFPFDCDECSLYCLTGSQIHHNNCAHKNLLDYIRHSNLDVFWYRKQVTVYHLTRIFSEDVTTGQNLVFKMFLTSPGPFPTYYDGEMREALGVLTQSNLLG